MNKIAEKRINAPINTFDGLFPANLTTTCAVPSFMDIGTFNMLKLKKQLFSEYKYIGRYSAWSTEISTMPLTTREITQIPYTEIYILIKNTWYLVYADFRSQENIMYNNFISLRLC